MNPLSARRSLRHRGWRQRTDLDLGHYERFVDEDLTRYSSVTLRAGLFNVLSASAKAATTAAPCRSFPHITDEIKEKLYRVGEKADVVITEIGGTVGDIEGQPFIEAIRQFQWEMPPERTLFIHVTLIPYLKTSQELKTKPTQHSVKELQGMGIHPGMLVCRSDYPIPPEIARQALSADLQCPRQIHHSGPRRRVRSSRCR